MKTQITTMLMIFISFNFAHAQFAENNAIYATGELNLGNYIGGNFNLNYVLQEKYNFKIGYTENIRKPKSQPEDFSSGLVGMLVFGLSNPFDHFESFQATAGRIYKINQSGTIRANISIGVGYTIIKEPENWEKINNNAVTISRNYSWDYAKHNTISLIVNPIIEFPFTRFYGLTVSPMLQINKDRTYFGIGIGQMIGLLRKRKN